METEIGEIVTQGISIIWLFPTIVFSYMIGNILGYREAMKRAIKILVELRGAIKDAD
jgi:hypothetical protein